MKHAILFVLSVVITAAAAITPAAWAQSPPPEVRTSLPAAALSDQAKLRFFGFDIYQASLWVTPGFSAPAFDQYMFALELTYLRDFQAADIAKRSIDEMQRQTTLPAQQQTQWAQYMREVFPNVKAGDRITGVHQPGIGAAFWHNGQRVGKIRDPTFSQLFFGIWLAKQTSDPKLRQSLLANAQTGSAK